MSSLPDAPAMGLDEIAARLSRTEALAEEAVRLLRALSTPGPVAPRLHAVTEAEILLQTGSYFYVFPPADLNHAISYLDANFDKGTRTAVALGVTAGATYLDIGANAGTMAAIAARSAGARGRVITVEPLAQMTEVIARNVFLNAPTTPHRHHVAAIAETAGTMVFHVNPRDSRVSTAFLDPADSPAERPLDRVEIPTLALADIWPGGPEPLFVKIDAEGAETGILEQLLELCPAEAGRQVTVLFEYGPDHLNRSGRGAAALADLLAGRGLQPRRVAPQSGILQPGEPLTPATAPGNLVFTLPA